jgi:hypothetical protein
LIRTYQKLPENEKKNCAIWAGNYGEAGSILYYGRVTGLPSPVCFNDQFLLWTPDSLNCSTLIHVDFDTSGIGRLFGKVILAGTLNSPYARESGLPVLLCSEPKAVFQNEYREYRERRMRVYQRKPVG